VLWTGWRRLLFAILMGMGLLAAAEAVRAQQYTADRAASDELTAYLRRNRLPLVGAEVLKTKDGAERVLLYGFVATDFGKHDAESKARAHLGIKGIAVENRIVLRPEIGKLQSRGRSGTGVASQTSDQTEKSLDQVIDEIQRYGIKSPPGEENLGSP